jgi:hypothetical protein
MGERRSFSLSPPMKSLFQRVIGRLRGDGRRELFFPLPSPEQPLSQGNWEDICVFLRGVLYQKILSRGSGYQEVSVINSVSVIHLLIFLYFLLFD